MEQIDKTHPFPDRHAYDLKANILEAVAEHPSRGRLGPAHPMAGTEYSGPEAAVKDLFKGKTMVLCDVRRSDEDAFEMIGGLVEELEMRTVFMNASEHDVHKIGRASCRERECQYV